jgi:hypothetical protein
MGVLHCFHQNAGTFKKSFFSLFSSSAHSNTPSTAMRDYKNLVRDTRMRLSVVRFKPQTRSGKPQYPLTKRRLNFKWRRGDPSNDTRPSHDSLWAKWVVKNSELGQKIWNGLNDSGGRQIVQQIQRYLLFTHFGVEDYWRDDGTKENKMVVDPFQFNVYEDNLAASEFGYTGSEYYRRDWISPNDFERFCTKKGHALHCKKGCISESSEL